jgi:hypothetical protein
MSGNSYGNNLPHFVVHTHTYVRIHAYKHIIYVHRLVLDITYILTCIIKDEYYINRLMMSVGMKNSVDISSV